MTMARTVAEIQPPGWDVLLLVGAVGVLLGVPAGAALLFVLLGAPMPSSWHEESWVGRGRQLRLLVQSRMVWALGRRDPDATEPIDRPGGDR